MIFSLVEVKNKKTRKAFLELPLKLYSNDPAWIRPLDRDIENVFNHQKNKHFLHGEAIRWILVDEAEVIVGRIAAFIDYETAKTNEQPTGGIGFFECINNHDAASIMFNRCKQWLKERGMEAMDGPINFGDRDRWWGLLVDGFFEPNYCMGYNHKYYQNLFETYGFKAYYNQYTYHRLVNQQDINPVIWEKAERIAKNPAYQIISISKNNLQKFTEDFRTIYNNAWGKYSGIKKITQTHASLLLKTVKPVLDERLMYFAYYNKEPIGFLIMLPELNQIVKHLNGNFNLWGKIKFMYLLKVKKVCSKAVGVIFGIVPQHLGKGLEGAMVNELAKRAFSKDFPYSEIELNWIGDFNPGMRRVAEQIGGKIRKTHITFRYMFDRSKEVMPHKRVN